jgi:hypothetical protein
MKYNFVRLYNLKWVKDYINKGVTSMQQKSNDVSRKKKLPDVGQLVRSKKYSTLWRIVEKREIWQHTANFLEAAEDALVPAIFLGFSKVQKGVWPGCEKMIGYTYALYDGTFESNWVVVESKDEVEDS